MNKSWTLVNNNDVSILVYGSPLVKTSPSNAGGTGWGTKIPSVSRPKNQNIKIEEILQQIQ